MRDKGNPLLAARIREHISAVHKFMDLCIQDAINDDGIITKRESKLLHKIEHLSKKYVNAMMDYHNSIIGDSPSIDEFEVTSSGDKGDNDENSDDG